MSPSIHPTQQDALRWFAFPPRPGRFRAWPALVATVALLHALRRTRQHFSTLDDRALADVGLSRTQQRIECAKSFWQL